MRLHWAFTSQQKQHKHKHKAIMQRLFGIFSNSPFRKPPESENQQSFLDISLVDQDEIVENSDALEAVANALLNRFVAQGYLEAAADGELDEKMSKKAEKDHKTIESKFAILPLTLRTREIRRMLTRGFSDEGVLWCRG